MLGNWPKFKTAVSRCARICRLQPHSAARAAALCRSLHSQSIATTIGKFSVQGDAPEIIAGEYVALSNGIKDALTPSGFYLSLKAPALEFQTPLIEKVIAAAMNNGHGIQFDSHGHELAQPTLQMLRHALSRYPSNGQTKDEWQFGITLPTRWKRSIADARWAAKNRVRVRLVKGEFKAEQSSEEMDPRKGFMWLLENLTGCSQEIAIATHDHKLAEKAIGYAKKMHQPIQLELLFGMPCGDMIALAKSMNVSIRFYVAYGDLLLLYGIHHLLANPNKLFRSRAKEMLADHKTKLTRILNAI